MMTAEQLKNSILQLAMQGKLVEQRPEEGTGEELYKELIHEQKALIKQGRIKQKNQLGDIGEEEIRYDIPPSWSWARIEECGYFVSGYTPKNNQLSTEGTIPYFKVSDMNTVGNEKYLSITDLYLSPDVVNPKIFEEGTIVYPKNGGAVFTNKKRVLIKKSIIDLNTGGFKSLKPLDFDFIYLLFSSIDFRQYSKGTALPTVDMEKIRKILFPIPPLAEQKRIVAKIEELMPFVEQYAATSTKLNTLNSTFPDQMKKSILQEAVMGKLVPQDPNDEPASVLLEEIAEEKKKLIKEGKIKKQKPLPEITEDEIPFDIPESWEWVRLGSIGITQTGNTPSKAHPEYSGVDIPFITPGDIADGVIIYTNQALSIEGKKVARVCEPGTILQVCIGGSIGKCAITKREVTFNQQINVISPILCNSSYLYAVMNSRYFTKVMKEKAGGTATPIINRGIWDSLLIPLPPVKEQERIVQKLNTVLPLCDRLK